MHDKNNCCGNKKDKNKKTAGNNQWANKNTKSDSSERRDGPGGENK